jgi:hypothetical protein
VKPIGRSQGAIVFQLAEHERDLLCHTLGLYPCIPPGHQRLSRAAKLEASCQQLLDEALAEQRAENRKEVAKFIGDSSRWSERQRGWRLRLSPSDVEWLLQVLNDIRVGSWVALGCPEERVEALDKTSAPHLWAMEIAGSFQMALLHVLPGAG